MQHIDRIDVLTTQLAETDRRALSQAWYSALHLAERPPRAAGSAAANGKAAERLPAMRRTSALPSTSLRGAPMRGGAAISARDLETRRNAAGASGAERRVPKTALARQLERALIRRAPRTAAAAFAVRAGDGRVHLLVRRDGTRTRLVAVCVPSLRERVERALAQARFALAGCGVVAEVA